MKSKTASSASRRVTGIVAAKAVSDFSGLQNGPAVRGTGLSPMLLPAADAALFHEAGALEFVYRPWLVMSPCVAPVLVEANSLAVGTGAFFSDIVDDEDQTVFSLPPPYRSLEEKLATTYAFCGVRPIGFRKAWSQLREMVGGKAVRQAPLAA